MKKNSGLVSLFFGIVALAFGCSGPEKQKTVTVELTGNPTTGYTWVYTISPEGILHKISTKYIPDQTGGAVGGSGGKFIFLFEALAEGEAELTFSYLRVWETDTSPAETRVYRATVDDKTGLMLTQQ
jgi:predicted secreted protein